MKIEKGIYYLFVLVTIAFISGCSGEGKDKETGNTTLSGELDNTGDQAFLLQDLNAREIVILDSIRPEEGRFSVKFDVDDPGFYRFSASDDNFITLIANPGENIQITADASNLQDSYRITGSSESSRLQRLNQNYRGFRRSADSLRQAVRQHQVNRNVNAYVQAINYQQVLQNKMVSSIKSFIEENPSSLASLAALDHLSPEEEFDYFKMVLKGLEKAVPQSEYYQSLKARVDEWSKLAVGGEAPEISLPNPKGEMVTLSSMRGKYVLIDFWASWCKPCRMENPNVVKLYQKYKDNGFEIFGVSLDKNKQAWLNAIQQDGLTWKHGSDLQFWSSAPAKTYNVTSIPQTVLIDPEGKIIAKNLRGSQLENKLEEIFSAS